MHGYLLLCRLHAQRIFRLKPCGALNVVTVTKLGIPHNHELNEEEHENRHERYALRPRVFRNRTRQTTICKRLIRGRKEMNKSRGDDDSGTKVFRNEEGPFRHADSSVSCSESRETSAEHGSDEDDEYRRYSRAHFSIVGIACVAVAGGAHKICVGRCRVVRGLPYHQVGQMCRHVGHYCGRRDRNVSVVGEVDLGRMSHTDYAIFLEI